MTNETNHITEIDAQSLWEPIFALADAENAAPLHKHEGAWLKLEAGMVLTVEPGCYVRPGENVPEKYWNIGVRIEDDALVTASGCEILTTGTPKQIADIESVMRPGP